MLRLKSPCYAALAAALHVFTLATPALAQQSGDTVVLKDGGMVKGTLTEMLPGDHATVQLPSGQTATIRWDVIHHIERGGVTVQTTPAPAAPAVVPPAPAPDTGKAVVHIEAEPEVILERQSSGQWVGMCNAPCDQEMALDANYRIGGDGVRRSGTFRLAGKNGDHVFINVSTASKSGFVGGIVLISVGAPAFLIGGLVLLVVAAIDATPGAGDTGSAKIIGWSMFGGGAAAVVLGIVLLSTNGHTSMDQSIDNARAQKKAAWIGVDTYRKMPIFRDFSVPGIPLPQTVPLFSRSF